MPADDAVSLFFPIRPLEDRQWMCFGVEHPSVQGYDIIVGEQQIEILETIQPKISDRKIRTEAGCYARLRSEEARRS